MSVTVTLIPFGESFVLPKVWIRETLPESVLAAALESDPEAKTIDIPNADVTPDVMALLVKLSQGKEPNLHNPNLIAAHRYLGLPSLLAYADPHYGNIPNRRDGNSFRNQGFIIYTVYEQDRVHLFRYLVKKGYTPDYRDLKEVIERNAVGVMAVLLTYPDINPAAYHNEPIRMAAEWGHPDIVKLLLADSRVDPNDYYMDDDGKIHDAALVKASGRPYDSDSVDVLLRDPRVNPNIQNGQALKYALNRKSPDITMKLLADPRTNPTADLFAWALNVDVMHLQLLVLYEKAEDASPD